MKRILILSNHVLGLYSFRRELITKLITVGFKVIISAPNHDKSAFFTDLGCEFIATPFNRKGINPFADIKLLFNYYRIIKNKKPNIVLSYTIKPNVYGGLACRFLGVKYLSNITGLGSAVENASFLQKITFLLQKIALKNADCIFFQNKENLDYLVKNNIVDKNKSTLLPGSGVNLDYFKILDYPSDEIIKFVFISRIMKEKGIDYYLDAAVRLKSIYSNIEFHICGACEEDYQERLEQMQKRGVIFYHGRMSDIREIHKISHCTIHPTYYPEGMSNVLLESAACARPIITTDRSGCKEVVDDGINGYICKQKDLNDLIDKIEKFIKLPYEEKREMGLRGRKKIEKEFDREIVIKAYFDEIDKILGK